jgi:hypothetical protein
MQERLIRLVRCLARSVLDAVLRPRGGTQLWPLAIWFLLPAAVKKASAFPNSFKPFGAVTTGFSVLRFTSHLSYSLLVSDSGPLAQPYPGGLSTRKLGNPFQVTLKNLSIFDSHRARG